MEKNYQQVLVKKDEETKVSVIEIVADIFSAVMEEEVTPHQALCIINLVVAFIMVVFPIGMPVVLRLIFLVWFGAGYFQCKSTGMFDDEAID